MFVHLFFFALGMVIEIYNRGIVYENLTLVQVAGLVASGRV
jgi:hypothetical protein